MDRRDLRDLTCQELVELVTDYLDDALPDVERARFEVHLAVCEGCEHYLEQIRITVALARAAEGRLAGARPLRPAE